MIPPVRVAIAIFFGLVVATALSVAGDVLMVALGVFPKDGDITSQQALLLLASSYRAIFSILGAFVTALVAREYFMRAVLILGGIVTTLGAIGVLKWWYKLDGATLWYPVSLAVLAIPYCWLGGKLYASLKSAKS